MSSALDRGELASHMGRGHVARCASCQAFGHALASLDTRLSREAHLAAVPASGARRTRSPWLLAGPLAAGAAAAIAIAVGTSGEPDAPVVSESPPTADAPIHVGSVAERISQALATTPLDTELDNLIDDGKRGFRAVLATGGLR
jgi:hypothetical protein